MLSADPPQEVVCKGTTRYEHNLRETTDVMTPPTGCQLSAAALDVTTLVFLFGLLLTVLISRRRSPIR